MAINYPTTPDGRYFIVRGRLWRMTNPNLDEECKHQQTALLMTARRAIAVARRAGDSHAVANARKAVNDAKIALGERGPVWWTDDAPDWNRHLVKNTPYADQQ